MKREICGVMLTMTVLFTSAAWENGFTTAPAQSGEDLLMASIREHDAVKVAGLLSKQKPKRMDILVDEGTELNDVAIVKLLLRHGADPNSHVNSYTGTPLMVAAVKGHVEVIEELIRAGADPNTRSGFGSGAFCPLMLAIGYGHPRAVDALLRAGADPNVRSSPGPDDPSTPLMLAAHRGLSTVVRLLLKAGADPNVKDEKGRRALDWLAQYRNPVDEIRDLLTERRDPDARH